MKQFEVGMWYVSITGESDERIQGDLNDMNVRIISRSDSHLVCRDEYGNAHRLRIQTTVLNGQPTEFLIIRALEGIRFYATHPSP